MVLTRREHEIIGLLRGDPLIGPAAIAEALGTTRAAVNVHLSNLSRKGAILGRGYILSEQPGALVIGGANIDIKAASTATARLHTSNPGTGRSAPGGVARNIAENLARLGTPTRLIAAVGRDALGDRLLAETRAAGVRVDHVHRCDHPTGTYTAILDADGELVIAVADMSATDDLRPEHLHGARDLITHAQLLILDGNLSAATAAHVLDLGVSAGVRVLVDPVSVPKAAVFAPLVTAARPLFAITPNRGELGALTARATDTDEELLTAAAVLHERGVRHVWVRLGARGSLMSSAGEPPEFLAARPARVLDVTGAGDAMLAAFAHALLAGQDPPAAAAFGAAAAALTVESPHTVRPDLAARLLGAAPAEPTRRPR